MSIGGDLYRPSIDIFQFSGNHSRYADFSQNVFCHKTQCRIFRSLFAHKNQSFKMSKKLDQLTPELTEFIHDQKIFFVGTAASDGRVNVSPKGMDSLRVLDASHIAWLNLTGSGNETAAHLLRNNRMTIMFCAFEGKPLILRLYGKATIYHPRDESFSQYIDLFGDTAGARQIIILSIDLVQTSCGFAVPLMQYQEDRSILKDWATKQGEQGLHDYWERKNQQSIDGFETNIFSQID